jgi:putative ABC transport system substrate-binding protein
VREATDIERAVTALAQSANGGLIVLPAPSTVIHRDLIIELAAQYRLPAVYFERAFVAAGGLMSYGADVPHLFRRSATLVHKILQGAKSADLPVEQPTKFELVVNLKTAKAIGLTVPESFLLRADELIE